MGRPPYWDTERDERRYPTTSAPANAHEITVSTCLICGYEGTTRDVWHKPTWWREPDSEGRQITTTPRCLDILARRARVEANGDEWPLLERGENPDKPRRQAPAAAAPQPPEPVTEDKESWF